MVYLIDHEYDKDHRAFHMKERGEVLHPLKIRYHGTITDMSYDERYTEFLQPTGLLPFITLVNEGCRRIGSNGIGGFLLLLFVWSWDRLSVGRPRILNQRPWAHYRNNPDREPTWAYIWDTVSEMTNDPMVMYRHYAEETSEQVDWEPYGTFYRIGAAMTDLNPKCTEESHFWPLIGSGRGRSRIGLSIIGFT
ncbi:uncharacterized protein [Lolium perenne]|uniref:uncharacterized protein n=1 Tax=Lolium perenne TaxID=4522 RepID=UPI003A990C78